MVCETHDTQFLELGDDVRIKINGDPLCGDGHAGAPWVWEISIKHLEAKQPEESGRARFEQLVKRVGRHADGCLPRAAVAATNSTVSPVSTSWKPSLAAFATQSAASMPCLHAECGPH